MIYYREMSNNNNRNRNRNNNYNSEAQNAENAADYNRYYPVFHRLPRTRAERREMNEQLNQMNREAYENNRNRNNENNSNAWDAFYAAQAEEERKYREEHPEEYKNPYPEQVWKLQMLHRKNPELGDTSIAEELAMVHGNTRRLKRYVRSQKKKGVTLNQALNEYAQGGPYVEGTGTGQVRANNVPPENRKNLITMKNAKKLNLLANYYGEYFDPAPGAYEHYSRTKGNTRKRKTRKTRKSRKTRRT